MPAASLPSVSSGPTPESAGETLTLHFRSTAWRFVLATAKGRTRTGAEAREIAAFGTRGDGKTWGAFGGMIAHAKLHHEAAYPLPTKWLGVADTFASHKAKTHESLMAPGWAGTWTIRDEGHLAVFNDGHGELVHLRLFGVEDQAGMDRLRAECHGLWFEEPAPASVLVQSSGLSETAWGLGMTSQRLPSHAHPAIMTLNYPDEDHWTWQRFVVRQHPGTAYVRIPAGERASAEQRAEWARALAGRPDMLRRLLEGRPGTLLLGAQVAQGFNADTHVAYGRRLQPLHEWGPLWIGQDGGHTPTSVIAQRQQGRVCIVAAITSEHAGMRQHVEQELLPWLAQHAPWAVSTGRDHEALRVAYDPSLDTDEQADIESNPLRVMRRLLPGVYRAGPVSWEGRRDPLLATLNLLHQGTAVLQLDPEECVGLIRACNGGWYYPTSATGAVSRDLPKKPNHPHEDYGDALCYVLAAMQGMLKADGVIRKPFVSKRTFNVLDHGREAPDGPRFTVRRG